MFRTAFPSIISSSWLYIQQPKRYCCLLGSKQTAVSVWRMPVAVYTVLNSSWWTERPSETCRVSVQNKINLIHWCIWLVLLQKHSFTFFLQQLISYVYWTVHHLDSWVKRDQLDVTCFIISLFNAQHVSDVNTSILRNLRLICWVISWVVLLWRQPAYGYHTTTAKPQRNINTHRTRAIQPMK